MQPSLNLNPMLAFSSSSPLFGGIASLASSNPLFGGGGSPLEPYRQYLQSTYTAPVQNRVDSFLQSLQQQEQEFFGSPMQGGLMGSSANAGSTLAVGGLSPPMGQVGALSGNPMQAAMQSGTFDAQVAALKNMPQAPTETRYTISQEVDRSGNERTGGGYGVLQNPFAAQQPGGMQMGAFNAAQARNPAPSAPDSSDPRSMLGFQMGRNSGFF
jgi:hypothetical protein